MYRILCSWIVLECSSNDPDDVHEDDIGGRSRGKQGL